MSESPYITSSGVVIFNKEEDYFYKINISALKEINSLLESLERELNKSTKVYNARTAEASKLMFGLLKGFDKEIDISFNGKDLNLQRLLTIMHFVANKLSALTYIKVFKKLFIVECCRLIWARTNEYNHRHGKKPEILVLDCAIENFKKLSPIRFKNALIKNFDVVITNDLAYKDFNNIYFNNDTFDPCIEEFGIEVLGFYKKLKNYYEKNDIIEFSSILKGYKEEQVEKEDIEPELRSKPVSKSDVILKTKQIKSSEEGIESELRSKPVSKSDVIPETKQIKSFEEDIEPELPSKPASKSDVIPKTKQIKSSEEDIEPEIPFAKALKSNESPIIKQIQKSIERLNNRADKKSTDKAKRIKSSLDEIYSNDGAKFTEKVKEALHDSNSKLYKSLNNHRRPFNFTFHGALGFFSIKTKSLQSALYQLGKEENKPT